MVEDSSEPLRAEPTAPSATNAATAMNHGRRHSGPFSGVAVDLGLGATGGGNSESLFMLRTYALAFLLCLWEQTDTRHY